MSITPHTSRPWRRLLQISGLVMLLTTIVQVRGQSAHVRVWPCDDPAVDCKHVCGNRGGFRVDTSPDETFSSFNAEYVCNGAHGTVDTATVRADRSSFTQADRGLPLGFLLYVVGLLCLQGIWSALSAALHITQLMLILTLLAAGVFIALQTWQWLQPKIQYGAFAALQHLSASTEPASSAAALNDNAASAAAATGNAPIRPVDAIPHALNNDNTRADRDLLDGLRRLLEQGHAQDATTT